MKNRFRFKLTASFAVTAIVPLLIMGIVAVATIYQTRRQSVIELENQALLQIKEKINKFIAEKAETTKLRVKLDRDFYDAAELSESQKMFFMEGFIREVPDILEVTLLDKDGGEIGRLLNHQKTSLSILTSQKNLPTYQKTKENEVYYGPIEHTLFGPIMTISTPILNDQENFIGANVIKITVNFLTDYIEEQAIGSTGYFLLVDQDGYFISQGKKWNDKLPLFKKSTHANNIDLLAKTTGLFYEQGDLNSQPVVIGEMLVDENLGWRIVAVWPKDDAFAVVRIVTFEIILTTIVSLLIVLILSALLSRQVVQPLELLEEKSALIGEGKFDQKVEINTNDEFEELGESFNKMAKGLKEVQRLKDEFVFIAAHELRTPVTAIKGYLSMAIDGDFGKLSAELEPILKKVNGANEQLVQLVNDLLEIARAEAGRIQIDIQKVDLVKITQKVVDSLGAWAEMSDVKLVYEQPQSDLRVMADENKLTEVLNNFGSNAIKYNKSGGIVTIKHEERDGEIVTMVRDTGIGMTKEELSHLFEKFYRAENDEVRKVQGTGLGLFIVKQIVEKMGGRVEVASEWGKGSTFSFWLKRG